jgi:carbamoyltransferase
MYVLGLNIRHGDTSACIFRDGQLIAAAEEERFIGIKNTSLFPINSIKYCLNQASIRMDEINYVTHNSNFSYNIFYKFFYFVKIFFISPYKIFSLFYNFSFKKVIIKNQIKLFFGNECKFKVISIPHHLAHVFSAIGHPISDARTLVFSFDGSGDFSTIESYLVNNTNLKLIKKNFFPHSLGFLYTAFTQYLGFFNYGDEYKVMGLSGYGKPIYYKKIMQLIKNLDPFKLNMKYFNVPKITYISGKPIIEVIFNDKFIDLFGKPRNKNKNDDLVDQIYKDYAASIQKVFEDIVISNLIKLKDKYNVKKLFVTGGCALNSLLISKIVERKIFEDVKINSNPGDAGGAIGSALKFLFDQNIKVNFTNINNNVFLGPSYDDQYIEKHVINNIVNKNIYSVKLYKNFNDLASRAAFLIKEKKIIFFFQDASEWGPRALGNRSILADPSDKNIKDKLNKNIKKRELFRPFAPAVMAEFANDYFYMHEIQSPFMNIIFKAKENTKNLYPGIVHVDGSSRVQTVSEKENNKFYKLINEFYKITNCPMLINTSLNVNGPMAQTPSDAFYYFLETNAECIILNNWLIEKKEFNY